MTTIKITELSSIGANLATSTVLPVVNMAGTPTTEKTTIGNIANVVLAGAGGNYLPAAVSILAQSVTNAAQPNITSIGTLTGLTVSNAGGTVNLVTTANVSLGAVANVHITGGTTGQVLTTNGAGGLSWATVSGGSYSNSDVANYLPTYTGNVGVDTLVFSDNSFQATAFVGTATTAEGLSNVGNATVVVDPLGANVVWTFDTTGKITFPTLTVDLHNGGNQSAQTLQFGNATQQAVITGPTPAENVNAERLILQGQRGNGTGEGGDVYVWAGDANTNGGDIKIYAGDADAAENATGGYINLDGGSGANGGGQLTLTGGYSSGGQGGQISITPGYSGNGNGSTLTLNGGQASGDGGAVNITAGYGGANGGAVTIQGGQSALGLPGYGNVLIGAGASTWTFDNTGNLSLAGGGSLYGVGSTPSGAPGNTIVLQPAGSGYTTNQKLMVYPTAGDGDHIHVVTGNLYQTELFLGDDNFFVKLANTGNVVINTNDNNGNTAIWTFDSDGNLTLPGNTLAINFANGNPALSNSVQWTTAPISNTATGTAGQAAYDAGGNLFICVATNTWAKFAGTTSW